MSVKVLIIEDDENFVYIIKRSIEDDTKQSYKIVDVATLAEAKKIDKKNINIILTDLKLPDCTSSRTYIELEKTFPDIPKIILTSRIDKEFEEAMLRVGALKYITKDELSNIDLNELIQNSLEE